MILLTKHDFETVAGQERIILTIHSLQSKLQILEAEIAELRQREQQVEAELQSPEAY